MKVCKLIFLFLLSVLVQGVVYAKAPDHIDAGRKKQEEVKRKVGYRSDCATANAQIDMSINNVRARLLTGGDVWWDFRTREGKYVVPKVEPGSGVLEVSSIYAAAVWLGGFDDAGNLKVAGITYRSQNSNDYWPGPLSDDGQTSASVCREWDKFFRVLGTNIDAHIRAFREAQEAGRDYTSDMIPRDVLGWPSSGNPYFEGIHGFELPTSSQGLAGFYDLDGNGVYDPTGGDYPIIEIRGCEDPQYPDEMIFWIYNDAGNLHTSSNGDKIQMEVQVQAFAYSRTDEINDMTFQRYKLINRAIQPITDTYFAIWVDPDLGCYQDDYIGCDSTRSLMYVYNEDAVDGFSGCDCSGVPTYCNNVPILGVDYFRGPLDLDKPILDSLGEETGQFEEIGMSSFIYFNNPSIGSPNPATTDPSNALEFYRYLSGFWRDGTPITYGGNGYNPSGTPVKYVFPSSPDGTAATDWSMCREQLAYGDRRTVQASGPFTLKPGAVNELIIGVVWLPSQRYPCPSIRPLQNADDISQALFDNCFDINDGPDAPDMCFVELDKELIVLLTNDASSNNYKEEYMEKDLEAPQTVEDPFYRFEGYKVYQLRGPEVNSNEIDDADKARLVFQSDVKNGVSKIYNWRPVEDPNEKFNIFVPEIRVEGGDRGVQHTFRIAEDQFAATDRRLVNHKKYYYTVVAYGYNDYETFDASTGNGQRKPYIRGNKNTNVYIVTPRPIVSTYLNAEYGEGMEIVRLDGRGNGGIFLNVESDSAFHNAVLDGTFDGSITYAKGQGPVDVKVVNPLEVRDADLELSFFNEDGSVGVKDDTRWKIRDLNTGEEIFSEVPVSRINEQILREYGVSVAIRQVDTVGQRAVDGSADPTNGTIGARINYKDDSKPYWFAGIPDNDGSGGILNYIKNGFNEADFALDPTQALNRIGDGFFAPLYIMDYRFASTTFMISPMVVDNDFGASLRSRATPGNLNNIDLVLTPDKSKWSRSVVIQTANLYYSVLGFTPADGTRMFDHRRTPSIGLDGRYATNDGTITGTPLTTASSDPNDPNYIWPVGMGWFPGYAIDVECGTRVNVFFGENSVYDESYQNLYEDQKTIGNDMIWNPSSQVILEGQNLPILTYFGGQHFIYLTNQPYDGCNFIRGRLDPARNYLWKRDAFNYFTWAAFPILMPQTKLLSYDEGLIPNEATVQLRVNRQYSTGCATGENDGMPKYRITLRGLQTAELDEPGVENALDAVAAVPNPYYGYSSYETNQRVNTIKITNLPDKCTVTIYSLDGKFIKQYKRDESPMIKTGSNPGTRAMQTIPSLEWDLRNDKNIPVSSGVYLIHVNAGEMGERVIKWFGVNRKFDPSGL